MAFKLKILNFQMFSKNAVLLKLVKARKTTRMKTKKELSIDHSSIETFNTR